MEEWGHPPESDASCTVALVAGELAADAVRHGHVPGREFHLHLRLALDEASGSVRIEVADAATGNPGVHASPYALNAHRRQPVPLT
ncbi:hypothetical protein [Streptomyces sp. NPDC020298]|uniref:hypothetical protein n=1 Tax=unclassified Streptomyces TaxID=2593676 RepID=UPI0033EDBBD3